MERLYEIKVKVTETHRIYKRANCYKEAQHAIEDSLHAQEEGRDVQVVYESYRHLDKV